MAHDPEGDEWLQLEVVKAQMRRAAREVILEEPHGGLRDMGYQLAVAMGAMRCVVAGDASSLCRLGDRSPAVRAAIARSGGRDMVDTMARVVEEAFFRFLKAQLAQELTRGEGAADSQTEQSSKQKCAHILRVAPARIGAVFDEDGWRTPAQKIRSGSALIGRGFSLSRLTRRRRPPWRAVEFLVCRIASGLCRMTTSPP